jgi:transcriptional regulator with XRE-family HTH domain
MLRQLRIASGLTQERLAERSGIRATGVAALESGRRKSPKLNTVGLLYDALKLNDDQRAALIVAATHNNTSSVEAQSPRVGLPKPRLNPFILGIGPLSGGRSDGNDHLQRALHLG